MFVLKDKKCQSQDLNNYVKVINVNGKIIYLFKDITSYLSGMK